MDRDDLDRELERLREATSAIAPDERFTPALVAAAASAPRAGDPLAKIARNTASLDPGAAFTDAVLESAARVPLRAGRASPSWLDGVVRGGPLAVGLAAALAAACLLLFVADRSELDEQVAVTLGAVEGLE